MQGQSTRGKLKHSYRRAFILNTQIHMIIQTRTFLLNTKRMSRSCDQLVYHQLQMNHDVIDKTGLHHTEVIEMIHN